MILSQSEKYGGRPFASSSNDPFHSFLDSFGIVDLGFTGNPFTWSNKRQNHHLIKERLDRGIANSQWVHLFPHFVVHHLLAQTSNHNLIILDTAPSDLSLPRPLNFRNFGLMIPRVIPLSPRHGLKAFKALLHLFSLRNSKLPNQL
jgi:hypothetical protein